MLTSQQPSASQKKLRASETCIADLEVQVSFLSTQLCEKMDELSDMIKMVSFMMDNGDVALFDSLHDAAVSCGV